MDLDSENAVATRSADRGMPLVSVVVPCRNEVDHIRPFVDSLRAQDYPLDRVEFLVADGMSNDGTRDALAELSAAEPRLVVIDNPGRTVPCGLNALIRRARGDVIVRMDVHTSYAADYVSRCVDVLEMSGADCVGGPWRAVGTRYLERVIAAGFQSGFGSGGARSHSEDFEGEVDSVYLGCWRRGTLMRLGMFDEDLVRNQDDELCLRIVKGGGRVWQSPLIRSAYRPRNSLVSLWRQYYQYGYWKVRVIMKHGQPAAARHLVPVVAVVLGAGLLLTSIKVDTARWILGALIGCYAVAALVAAGRACFLAKDWRLLPGIPLAFAVYHASYGVGFLRGIVDFLVLKRRPPAHASRLSR